jgi:oxygen-independent coproporphyrinogen-3 oxidase
MTHASLVTELDASLLDRFEADQQRAFDYPPAAQLRADFGEHALRAVIAASNEEPIPRPLALDVRLRPCSHAEGRAQLGCYLDRLYREIELIAPLFDRDRPVHRLQLGGEGAGALDLPAARELMESLGRHFSFSTLAQRDYGVEVDPARVDATHVEALAGLGFNRLNVRVAGEDVACAGESDRARIDAQTVAVIAAARTAHLRSVSVQVAYDTPRPGSVNLGGTLDTLLALRPDRVMLITSAASASSPRPAARLAMFGLAVQQLLDAGYMHLGMGQFARAEDELAVAQRVGTLRWCFPGYSAQGTCDIVGLGAGAQSCIGDSCSRNASDVAAYAAALDNACLPVVRGMTLDEDDLIRRDLMASLLGRCIIDKATFGARHRLLFDEYFVRGRQCLQPLIADGLLEEDARALRVTSRGRLLLRIIGRCFDAYHDVEAQSARQVRAV